MSWVTDAVELAPFDAESYYQDSPGFFARLRESRPVARFPGLSLAVPAEELRWRPVSLMTGLESLPVRLA